MRPGSPLYQKDAWLETIVPATDGTVAFCYGLISGHCAAANVKLPESISNSKTAKNLNDNEIMSVTEGRAFIKEKQQEMVMASCLRPQSSRFHPEPSPLPLPSSPIPIHTITHNQLELRDRNHFSIIFFRGSRLPPEHQRSLAHKCLVQTSLPTNCPPPLHSEMIIFHHQLHHQDHPSAL